MILNVPAERFHGKSLSFRPFLGDDHVAEIDGLRAGWILQRGANGSQSWWWTMTGPCCGHGRIASHGEARTLEDAKAAFREAFEEWRQWALSETEPVRWFGQAYEPVESSFLPHNP